MGKKNREKKSPFFGDNYFQSANFNQKVFALYLEELVSLALNRFRWTGLPSTCDERFLEWALLRHGLATVCYNRDYPDIWQSLIAMPHGEFDAYGNATAWTATGFNSQTNYEVTPENGFLCYYSQTRINPWNAIQIFARKLTHYSRTEDINLSHQHKPKLYIAPPEKKMELINVAKQVEGYEPAILTSDGFDWKEAVQVIDTGVPLEVESLARAQLNVLNQYLMYIGIPHLAFEKGERMIEDEARANTAPTNIMLLNCLKARRKMCDDAREYGLDLHVYFNDDWESYNFNYVNNVESMAQDGLIGGVGDGTE